MEKVSLPMKMERTSNADLDAILGNPFAVLDHGFVRVIDYMGDDAAIVQAARVSYGAGTKSLSDDAGLIRYLMRHAHTTPFEMCELKLHLKMPIFVARQWIRHRMASINEVSARYSILSKEFYVPDAKALAKQSATNKQGRDEGYSASDQAAIQMLIEGACEVAFETYESMASEANQNLARELARVVLPLATYTEFYWKIDLHNLLHFLRLRSDAHAQAEIRAYAAPIESLVRVWCPLAYRAYLDYRKNAASLSAQELAVVQALLTGNNPKPLLAMLSPREVSEMSAKIGVTLQ